MSVSPIPPPPIPPTPDPKAPPVIIPGPPKILETKPGYLTTEFWTTVVTTVLGIIQLSTGAVDVNNKYVAIGMAIIVGLYNGSRGIAKAGLPYTK